MAQTIDLLGASYPDVPSVLLPKHGGGTASFTDVTDTTATASDVAAGKLFHAADGALTTGAASTRLVVGAMRPDAELVQSYKFNKNLVGDSLGTWPGYTTSATTLVASSQIGTYQANVTDYSYSVLLLMYMKPTYSTATNGKGRLEYWMGSYVYDLCDIAPNSFVAASGKTYASRNLVLSGNPTGREFYWTSGSAVNIYSTASYGLYMTPTHPTISDSGVITFSSPAFMTRGSSTYFTNTYMNAVTDVNIQYIFELYRSPNNSANIDGFMATSLAKRIMDGINGDGKLK